MSSIQGVFTVVAAVLIVSSLDLNPRLQTGRGFSRFVVHRLTPLKWTPREGETPILRS